MAKKKKSHDAGDDSHDARQALQITVEDLAALAFVDDDGEEEEGIKAKCA